MPRKGTARIGTSGWVYQHWKGPFYPEDLPQRAWFDHYAARFDTVEVNNTFYRLPTEAVVEKWRAQAPPGFLYAFKASRYVTHRKKLLPGGKYGDPVETFLDRLAPLGDLLGPVLFQLPPQMPLDLERLRDFLKRMPKPEGIRYVFEFRHPSWHVDEVLDLLGEHGVGFCIHDWRDAKAPLEVTSDVAYVRFHGATDSYVGEYGADKLRPWVERVETWRKRGRDVFVYFNNDWGAAAVRDARWLAGRLGVAKGKAARAGRAEGR